MNCPRLPGQAERQWIDQGKRAIDIGGRCIHRDRRVAAALLLGEVGGYVSMNLGPMVAVTDAWWFASIPESTLVVTLAGRSWTERQAHGAGLAD